MTILNTTPVNNSYHINSEFSKICIELTRETETSGYARHCDRDKMIQVTIGGRRQLQGSETNVVKSLVVDAKCLICVFY